MTNQIAISDTAGINNPLTIKTPPINEEELLADQNKGNSKRKVKWRNNQEERVCDMKKVGNVRKQKHSKEEENTNKKVK